MKDYPHLNDTYMTDRLKEQLLEIRNYAMTILVAPAGYGKSTAVTWWDEYRRHYIHHSVSYRLNVLSGDLDSTWNDLCDILGRDAPVFSEKLRRIGFPQSRQSMQLISQLWKEEAKKEREVYLIIDDAHLLSYGALVPVLLFLAERRPAWLHLILVSRNIIFSPSQRMKLGRTVYQITAESFQLNREEIDGYACQCGLTLSPEDTDQLAAFSDGWISLIYLAFCNYVHTGTWQFGTADIDRLITEVMLDPLEEQVRDFLKVCSVAPRFTREEAEFLWNGPQAGEFLDRLSHENAFIVRDKEGVYRCHNLLLQNTMKEFRQLPAERQESVWQRLGDWHYGREEYLAAAIAYRKAQAWDPLLQTVAVDRNGSFGGTHMVLTHEWYRSCPREILGRHPDAVLIFALQHFIDGDIPTMLKLNRFLMEAVDSDPDLSEQERANFAGESEILLGFLEFNSIDGMSRHHRAACELMDRESLLVNHRSPWTFGSPSILALYHRQPGMLEAENRSMQECMPYYYELTDHHGNGSERSMQAETELMQGHFQDAEIHYFHAVRAARRKKQYSILITAEFTAMRIAVFQGEFSRAEQQLKDLRRQMLDNGEFVLLPTVDLCEVWIYALLGQTDRIPKSIWAEDLVQTITAVSAPVVVTIRNEALLACGEYTELVSLYEENKISCENARMLLCGIYVRIQTAAALVQLERMEIACRLLKEALDLALPDQLLLPFAEHGQLLHPLLEQLEQIECYKEPVKQIAELSGLFEKACQKVRREYFGMLPELDLSPREMEIAHLAAKRMTTKEISERLCLSENTVRNHLGHIFEKLGMEGSFRNKREKLAEIMQGADIS